MKSNIYIPSEPDTAVTFLYSCQNYDGISNNQIRRYITTFWLLQKKNYRLNTYILQTAAAEQEVLCGQM